MKLRTCRCGRPFQPRTPRTFRCPVCEVRGRDGASPSNRAQRDGTGDYDRNRTTLLATNPPCIYCGAPAKTADHRIAVADGGTNELSNLVPACGTCNFSKQAGSAPKQRARTAVPASDRMASRAPGGGPRDR